ncbi:MAG TPA: hypothetical protein VKU41_26070 [Polyangiaceae bacterium]|nr:hypothetical protein [Polyangiaceae bacterium]
MLRAWGWLGVISMAGALVACSMLKKKAPADGGEDAPAASESAVEAAAPAAALAANDSEVTRYPDEKAVDHAPLTTVVPAYLRTQANAGDTVVALKTGTEVEKLAERGNSYLVLADDPKDPSRKLMGWVSESSFAAGAAHVVHGGAVAADAEAPGHDAGHGAGPAPGPAPGPPKPLDTRQTNGACPAGYNKCGAACRLACKADADCGLGTAHCAGGFCMGPGAAACK